MARMAIIAPMPFERLPFDTETHVANVQMFQQEAFGAIYLIDDDRKAIVETGTSWDANRILEAVRSFGLKPADIDALVVSHIHLDHAGGAGFLLPEMPRAKVYVHPRGLKHLVDPTKLVASAREALGKHTLVFFDSPGHAPHELTILDERNRCVYTGDAAGLYFPGDEILMPVTPAPAFDLEKNLETFRRLLALKPRGLLFSHYGPHSKPAAAIEAMMAAYPAWARSVRNKLASMGEDGVLRELYD